MPNNVVAASEVIIGVATLLSAIIAIFGIVFTVYRWYLKQNKQDEEIKAIKEDLTLLTFGTLACLKGLKEKGCNGPVTEAINKIEKHLNQYAHR